MPSAVIDLGTNTCNLVIVRTNKDGKQELIYSGSEPVKLGQGGIDKRIITPDAMQRGLKAISNHLNRIQNAGCENVRAIATSAVRNAQNKDAFLNLIREKTGLEFEVITGDKEAEYIYKGAKLAVGFQKEKVLILDIGGGSNEFIIGNGREIYWKQSFEIGVARIREKFKPKDPISDEEIKQIEAHFDHHLTPLWQAVTEHPVSTLIGCSGAFDSFVDMLEGLEPESTFRVKTEIAPSDFFSLHHKIVISDHATRKTMKGLDPVRIEMIVIASIFVNFVLRKLNIHTIIQSGYALKEGVLAEMLNTDHLG
ncbi:MAG: phosphatase [Bacteroidota bacterium]|nr:phosphatase [Bacteroidota bacterium]